MTSYESLLNFAILDILRFNLQLYTWSPRSTTISDQSSFSSLENFQNSTLGSPVCSAGRPTASLDSRARAVNILDERIYFNLLATEIFSGKVARGVSNFPPSSPPSHTPAHSQPFAYPPGYQYTRTNRRSKY